MKTITQVYVLLLAWTMLGLAHAVDYQAYAPVLSVEPVIETRYEPVSRRVCTEPDATGRDFNEVAATIGEDIRRQSRLWQQQQRCRTVTEQRAREDITGYRVTYRYGGRTNTTRLSYDPGKQMPVNVNLVPMH
jgi:uncharacterized protein YcfJ